AALHDRAFVLLLEAEAVHLLFQQELGVADVFHLAPTHHLADDHLTVLVADVHALEPVDFLDFVHQVSLQLLLAENGENVVRVQRTIHQRLASPYAFAFLHVDVHATRHGILFLRTVVGGHIHLALAFTDFTEPHYTVNLRNDSGFVRLAGLEQLDHARQTTGDVFGLGGFARVLGQHVVRRIGDHEARQAGDLVHFLVESDPFLQVFELHRATNFRQDGEGVRVPLDHYLTELHVIALFDLYPCAVHHGVAFFLSALLVHDRD